MPSISPSCQFIRLWSTESFQMSLSIPACHLFLSLCSCQLSLHSLFQQSANKLLVCRMPLTPVMPTLLVYHQARSSPFQCSVCVHCDIKPLIVYNGHEGCTFQGERQKKAANLLPLDWNPLESRCRTSMTAWFPPSPDETWSGVWCGVGFNGVKTGSQPYFHRCFRDTKDRFAVRLRTTQKARNCLQHRQYVRRFEGFRKCQDQSKHKWKVEFYCSDQAP